MTDIQWKNINNYINYSISNTGLIKNNKTDRILKYYIRNGYPSVTLCYNNKKKTINIHQIVAEHFLEKPNINKYVINHKNEDKTDNNILNLEYVSYSYNTKYSMTSNRSKNTSIFNIELFNDIPNYTNYMISKNGEIYSKKLNRLCCISIIPSGYCKIKLKGDNGIYRDLYIHVLVAMTYMNYIQTDPNIVINHKDGNKQNNILNNLEIITQKENMKHSVKINNDKLFRKKVYYIDKNLQTNVYISAKDASIKTGIDHSSIIKSCKSDKKMAGKIKWFYL